MVRISVGRILLVMMIRIRQFIVVVIATCFDTYVLVAHHVCRNFRITTAIFRRAQVVFLMTVHTWTSIFLEILIHLTSKRSRILGLVPCSPWRPVLPTVCITSDHSSYLKTVLDIVFLVVRRFDKLRCARLVLVLHFCWVYDS